MSPTPTRADVLREITDTIERGKCRCAECVSELLAEEVARLRAARAAMIRRVEALKPGDWITREDLLAALRDGGTDGQ